MRPTISVRNASDLSLAYTPGVARVCAAIADDDALAHHFTWVGGAVAVVSDGSAVLGLGDIGPSAAMPVMEGKALLFKQFAGVDAVPICLACTEVDELVVFHDDQHGAAIVVLAALRGAAKLTGRRLSDIRAVVAGAGASGVAVTRILLSAGIGDIAVSDSKGLIYQGRDGLNPVKAALARDTNAARLTGSTEEALRGADLFIGLSCGTVPETAIASMNPDAIVFALSNPEPEVSPVIARRYARVVATGRSDFPNQINNVLAFPGVFRGALDVRATDITEGMKLAAADAIASLVADELADDCVIPGPFDQRVAPAVAAAVAAQARVDGVARC